MAFIYIFIPFIISGPFRLSFTALRCPGSSPRSFSCLSDPRSQLETQRWRCVARFHPFRYLVSSSKYRATTESKSDNVKTRENASKVELSARLARFLRDHIYGRPTPSFMHVNMECALTPRYNSISRGYLRVMRSITRTTFSGID